MQKKNPEFLNLILYRNQIQMNHKPTGEKLNNKVSINKREHHHKIQEGKVLLRRNTQKNNHKKINCTVLKLRISVH